MAAPVAAQEAGKAAPTAVKTRVSPGQNDDDMAIPGTTQKVGKVADAGSPP